MHARTAEGGSNNLPRRIFQSTFIPLQSSIGTGVALRLLATSGHTPKARMKLYSTERMTVFLVDCIDSFTLGHFTHR